MDTKKAAYDAGVTKGKTEEKTKTLLSQAGDAAQSAKETITQAAQTIQATALGAFDGVKGATTTATTPATDVKK